MCERYIDQLPLVCSQLGTWPTTQACALTGNRTGDLSCLQASPQSAEPHQPGLHLHLLSGAEGIDVCLGCLRWEVMRSLLLSSRLKLSGAVLF